MTEAEYKEKQVQDTNQLGKAFDYGYQKGREEGVEEAYRAGYEEAAGVPEELENCLYEWLKEQGK